MKILNVIHVESVWIPISIVLLVITAISCMVIILDGLCEKKDYIILALAAIVIISICVCGLTIWNKPTTYIECFFEQENDITSEVLLNYEFVEQRGKIVKFKVINNDKNLILF